MRRQSSFRPLPGVSTSISGKYRQLLRDVEVFHSCSILLKISAADGLPAEDGLRVGRIVSLQKNSLDPINAGFLCLDLVPDDAWQLS